MLATPVSRLRWATSYVLLAVVGTTVVLAAFGVPAGLTYGLSSGNVGYELPRMLAAAMVPVRDLGDGRNRDGAVGLIPRFTLVSWGALVWIINRCYCDPLRSVHGCDEWGRPRALIARS